MKSKNAIPNSGEVPSQLAFKGDIVKISSLLRETVHDINNSLFVAKGFIEELRTDVQQESFRADDFDMKTFKEMFDAVARNIEKLDHSVQSIRDFAKQGIFSEPFSVPDLNGTDVNSAKHSARVS